MFPRILLGRYSKYYKLLAIFEPAVLLPPFDNKNNSVCGSLTALGGACNDDQTLDKGTPAERRGRKASGLRAFSERGKPTTAGPPETRMSAVRLKNTGRYKVRPPAQPAEISACPCITRRVPGQNNAIIRGWNRALQPGAWPSGAPNDEPRPMCLPYSLVWQSPCCHPGPR